MAAQIVEPDALERIAQVPAKTIQFGPVARQIARDVQHRDHPICQFGRLRMGFVRVGHFRYSAAFAVVWPVFQDCTVGRTSLQ